jgi:glycosyltransferase involved in cell wall biosynthesis
MIIGIDGNEANIDQRVGVNQYAFELLRNIWKLQDEWKAKHKLIVYLRQKPLSDMPRETLNFKYKVISGGRVWILTKLMPHLFTTREKPNIFFSPSHYIPPFAPMPRICAIMDLGYLEFSGQFTKKVFWQLKWWSAISILVSKRIISISNSTKDDIVRHYPFAKGKIYITPLAYDPERFNTRISANDVRRVKKKYSIVDDYILYLGMLKPSKNIEGLIEAFASISGIKLVIAGKKGWMYESIYKKAEKLGLSSKIVFTDFIPEADKPGLIKGAKVFVLPSFWEGFGLDVVSAMACGVPVVVSDVGSLPEVVGEAGILVDPTSPESIAGGITKVINLPESDYNSMVAKGISRAKKFSWEKTARATLEILENVQR